MMRSGKAAAVQRGACAAMRSGRQTTFAVTEFWLKALAALVAVAALHAAGCGGDAGVELAAGDALLTVAREMETTVAEYHEEVSRGDDSRESAVVSAFVTRVKADVADEAALDGHAAAFAEALGRIRADREAEWQRRTAAMENLSVLREMARGLQKLAIQSLTLEDEMRRYLEGWIQTRQRAANEVRSAK